MANQNVVVQDNVMAIAFSMGSFGHYLPNPTILLGTDRLLLKGIKYLAARMRPMPLVNN